MSPATPVTSDSTIPNRAVTLRSIALGLLGVILICSLTAYNDFVVSNTYIVGNFLPIGLLLFYLMFVLLINAPLLRWLPRHAFSGGELAVAMGMTLISCGLPSSGLMRYLPPQLVGLYYHAGDNSQQQQLLRDLELPDWMFPTFRSDDPALRKFDPVVQNYYGRTPVEGDSFRDHLLAVPWRAWLRPAITWGLFLSCLFGAILCLSVIVRRQWAENERLSFPLASVYAALIEPPPPGRALNDLFHARSFWLAFATVFFLHGLNALHEYAPKWPIIPLSFNLTDVLTQPPWRYLSADIKQATVYFVVVGLVYFVPTSTAFSIWFFVILFGWTTMLCGVFTSEFTGPMRVDQLYGGMIVFTLALLWIGRAHWALVGRHMLLRAGPDEPQGRYLPYAAAGWGFVLCLGGMLAWLLLAGMTMPGALVLLAMMMMAFFLIMRIVAETGMIFAQLAVPAQRPWIYLASSLPAHWSVRTSLRSYFLTSMFFAAFTFDLRESLPVFSLHSLRLADLGAYAQERHWRRPMAFFFCLVLALAVGYVVSGASMLYVEYNHAATLDSLGASPINEHATVVAVKSVLDGSERYESPAGGPQDAHNRLEHFAFGAALTGILSALRWRFVAWPLHPIGYLVANSYAAKKVWFSLFIGWAAKLLVLRLGGSRLFRQVRPLFVGLILGEATAAAFWLLVALARLSLGLEYHAIHLLPI